MSALTLLEAAKRTQNRLFQGIALSIVTTDELAAMIPFRTFAGQAITYIREGTIGTTGFIPDDGTLGSPDTGTDDVVSVPVRRIGRDLDVDTLADALDGGAHMGAQIGKKVKATWRLVAEKMATGGYVTGFSLSDNFQAGVLVDALVSSSPWLDSNRFGPGTLKYVHSGTLLSFRAPGDVTFGAAVDISGGDGSYTLYSHNPSKWIRVTLDVSDANANAERSIYFSSSTDEFDGMAKVCAPSMVRASIAGDGDAFAFAILDELMSLEKVRQNRAFVMNSQLINKFLSHLRATGGANPDHVKLPGHSGQTLTYRGVPILENDNIPSNEAKGSATTLSSIYLASLDADEGLFLGVPGTGHDTIDVEGDPRSRPVMGWLIERIGALEGKAHRRTRVQWHGALGLRSTLALARASEIITA